MNFITTIPEIFAAEYGLIQYVPVVVPDYSKLIQIEQIISIYMNI